VRCPFDGLPDPGGAGHWGGGVEVGLPEEGVVAPERPVQEAQKHPVGRLRLGRPAYVREIPSRGLAVVADPRYPRVGLLVQSGQERRGPRRQVSLAADILRGEPREPRERRVQAHAPLGLKEGVEVVGGLPQARGARRELVLVLRHQANEGPAGRRDVLAGRHGVRKARVSGLKS
jgi:hypothetical protein